jgi:predicted secreted protein
MTPMTAFFIYLLIWWVMLFTVLPLGVKPHGEEGRGFDAGAPEKPDLKRKLILNTIISAVILAVIEALVRTGVINWNEWFEGALQ